MTGSSTHQGGSLGLACNWCKKTWTICRRADRLLGDAPDVSQSHSSQIMLRFERLKGLPKGHFSGKRTMTEFITHLQLPLRKGGQT
jgi:hypothetical protein